MPGPGYAFVDEAERANLLAVLDEWQRNRFNPDGPQDELQIRVLERELRERLGARHVVTVNSGTSALLAALAALDLGPSDEVIVPGYMFVASIAAIVHAGATPVLAEIDASLTLDPADVRAKITPNTRAIMPVHMLGAPSDMTTLMEIAREHDLKVIEDNCQAAGGTYFGRILGTIGDAGAFSLNPYKVITAGDGGFVTLAEEHSYQRAYSFIDHGFFPIRQEEGSGDALLGLNLRMTEFTAAVGRAQLAKLDTVLSATRTVKKQLADAIGAHSGVTRRTLHDAAGECGTLLVYIFESAQAARDVAEALDTKTLLHSPKHYYGGIPALPALASGTGRPTPLRPALPAERRESYLPGALSHTDDVLDRALALSVGVHDPYLGAGFGAHVYSVAPEIEAAADRVRAVFDKVLT